MTFLQIFDSDTSPSHGLSHIQLILPLVELYDRAKDWRSLVIIPISHENPLGMVVDKKIFIPLHIRTSSFWLWNFTRYNWRR